MRDINRIPAITGRIASIWKQHPDLRISQLMINVIEAYKMLHNGTDPFYLEDEEFLQFMENYFS